MYKEELAVLIPQREEDSHKYGPYAKIVGFMWYTPEPASIPDLPTEYLTFPSYPCFVVECKEGERKYIPHDAIVVGHFKFGIYVESVPVPEEEV